MNWKAILHGTLWTLCIAGLILLLGFAGSRQERVICKDIKVDIDYKSDNFFVEKEDVDRVLYRYEDSLLNKKLGTIHIDTLEKALRKNPFVQDAQVFADLVGGLCVEVKQRKPLLRVINNMYRSFYIDDRGMKMPLSDKYTSRVIVANGNISERFGTIDTLQTQLAKDLFQLVSFIQKDEFWTAQVEQIYVNERNEIELIPRVGNHRIIIGDTSDLEEKFDNLMIFYNKALPKIGWNTYSAINVKFKNQLVCTKYQ
jgi:cell division protein FtsQ